MNVAIIAARGGSKRIKNKNIKLFRGKPIIYYSIRAALKSKCFERVIVSTDSLKIAKIAEKCGAEVPFLRSKDLSNDKVGNREVIIDAIKKIKFEKFPAYVCQILATAPFIDINDIKKSLSILKNSKSDFCFSVTKFQYPIQRALKITKSKRVKMFFKKFRKFHSQQLEESYHDAGQFYWGKTNSILKNKITFSEISIPYIIPSYRSIDIDDMHDWKQALLMSNYIFKK